jgi:hypothetical protein
MENKRIHLVVTYIENYYGNTEHYYYGEHNSIDCPMRVSFRASHKSLGVPLWFDSERDARKYIQTAYDINKEREFFLIQEFAYRNTLKDEARIIFSVKSDTWPVLAEGETERAPGIWARVRSLFICDGESASGYMRRFNEEAAEAFDRTGRSLQ